jgi:hypothetical protein
MELVSYKFKAKYRPSSWMISDDIDSTQLIIALRRAWRKIMIVKVK